MFPDNLSGDAYRTYVSHLNACKAGTVDKSSDEISSIYWADRVKSLDPIRVYMHRYSIVIVQSQNGGIEEGKYVGIPISSQEIRIGTGDDGFTFYTNHELGEDVYNYKRSI